MRRRIGLMSIGLAIVMLLFSLIATIILTNVGRNLIKAAVDMGKGQEEAYTRIVVQSMKNGLDGHSGSFGDLEIEAVLNSVPDFSFVISSDLNAEDDAELSIGFDTVAILLATKTIAGDMSIFDIQTEADHSTHGLDPIEEGVIIHFN